MLHSRCGDDIINRLREAGVPGTIAKWADPLCEGPLAPWPDEAARRAERAAWLAGYGTPAESVSADLSASDAALEGAAGEDEVVLWFEHDLFDQAILVYLLHRLATLGPTRTSLVDPGPFLPRPGFIGLGQLTAPELEGLFSSRAGVTEAQFALAHEAWAALSGGDPEQIWLLGTRDGLALPYLGPALLRYLAELPSLRTGLGQTESLALQAFAAGAETAGDAFVIASRFENRPWLGDTMFYSKLRDLASQPQQLLAPGGGSVPSVTDRAFLRTRFAITAAGQAVLAGKTQRVFPGGMNRLGSIRLDDGEASWRWDERAGRPVRTKGLKG